MPKTKHYRRARADLAGPKPVACDGRRRVLVPAHFRCVSSLARDQAPREDEHADLPTLDGARSRRTRRGVGRADMDVSTCLVEAQQIGEQTYYWTTCGNKTEGYTLAGELYVTRAKPTKDACRAGHSRKCAKALSTLPFIRTVDQIEVYSSYQRKGIATKLYERAAEDACRAGEPLVSYMRIPGSASHAFWKKQHEKGRAVAAGAYKRFDKRDGEEILVEEPIYALQCGAHRDLSGARKKRKRR